MDIRWWITERCSHEFFEGATEEDINKYVEALRWQTMRQAQPMNVGLLEVQQGGGLMQLRAPVQLESTQEKMQGLLDLLAMIKGPQG